MANLQKKQTILGTGIKRFQFSKMRVPRLYRDHIFGWLWLENGDRIQVEYGKYYILNKEGVRTRFIPSTNLGHKIIKRLITRWFTTYRNGEKWGQMHHVGYWISRAVDSLHNCGLFSNSNISFKKNQTNFLKLAS